MYNRRIHVIKEQLKLLEANWKKTNASYLFNMAAAALLMSGFSASLLLAACPPAVIVCYMVCTLAVAMYLTADLFGTYREKRFLLEHASNDQNRVKRQQEFNKARSDFVWAMVKNTVMPLLIITTFAICWEAALILTALYIGYECLKGYFVKPKQATPALEAPEELTTNEPTRTSNGASFLAFYKPQIAQDDRYQDDPKNRSWTSPLPL